jgi:hypothetical protein
MLSSALARAASTVNLKAFARVLQQDIMALEPAIRLQQRLGESLRWRSAGGIILRFDRRGQLHVRLAVTVRRDTDVRIAAGQVQDLVRETLDRISDAPIGGIHVLIAERR